MTLMAEPSSTGRFGEFGGRFVPETLVPACEELEAAFREAWADPSFRAELDRRAARLRRPAIDPHRVPQPRPTARHPPGAEARGPQPHRLAQDQQRARPGAAGQADGQEALVAETGAGQHGVASATAAALFGLECKVYMGAVDVARQALNVFRMRLLGSEVESVSSGSRTLKDAVNEAMRDWVATVGETHYCLGSVMGPHPYPWMVREFHRVIGDEATRAVPRAVRRRPRRRRRVRRRRLERDRHLQRLRRRPNVGWSASSPPGERRSGVACPGSCTACAAT